MKMRRKQTPLTQVQDHCANYQPNYICIGAYIGSKGEIWMDEELAEKPCLIKQGKECPYFETIVKRSIK